ncbi:TonB-dependent receptor domain-containing protein [Helicobacter anatolicus]|uniref:TonB-dependent receptor domain-containing protein n=1 Tax=Helicobacter anatolicus TaxID=2905874 RepID=UPI001E41FDDD|nr:TonB-dependent receptor [Helicobacter anatolicus]MCE3039683.1 TonB-dependent receptor [Helicobacter anatolicus]
MKSRILVTLLATSSVSLILAQEKEMRLDKIVTSASGYNQDIKDAPASISVVTREEVESKPVRDLAEAVSLVPGVSIDQSIGKTGGYDISIRGMPASYTLILMDGKRQNTTSAGFPNGFTEAFAGFMPPIAAIERIEVIRGPASTLYGSDAIGGIVNVVTRKQLDSWSGSLTLDSVFQEDSAFGNLYGASLWLGGPLDRAKKWTLSLRARDQYRAAVPTSALKVVPSNNGDNTTAGRNVIIGLSESNNSSFGIRLGYQMDPKNYFYLDFDHGLQWYDNSQSLLGTIGSRGGYKKNVFFMRNNVIFAHQGKYENFQTDTSLQYLSTLNYGRVITSSAVPKGSPLVGEDRGLLGQDVIFEHRGVFHIAESSVITLGGRYWFSSLIDKIVPVNSFLYHHNLALFAENETILRDDLALQLGMRGEYNSSFGFHVSPRAYLVWNILQSGHSNRDSNLVLKGGISTGYKTPTVIQLTKGINGLTGQGTTPTYGNPDLKPESSINYETSLSYENKFIDTGITGFFIQFRDKIQTTSVANGVQIPVSGGGACSAASGNCSYSINADSAISYGVESYFGIKPLGVGYGNIDFNLSYTYNHTEQTSGVARGLPLTGIPEHTFNGAINYGMPFGLAFYLRGELRANQLRTYIGGRSGSSASNQNDLDQFLAKNPNISKYYKPYFLLHLGGSYALNKTLRLNFGIYNLLNWDFVDYVQASDGNYYNNYNYIREGRRYYLSLSMDF